jgi:hypothetical protein
MRLRRLTKLNKGSSILPTAKFMKASALINKKNTLKASQLITKKDRQIQYGIYVILRTKYKITFEEFLTNTYKL